MNIKTMWYSSTLLHDVWMICTLFKGDVIDKKGGTKELAKTTKIFEYGNTRSGDVLMCCDHLEKKIYIKQIM